MKRRHALLAGGCCLGVLVSGCVGTGSGPVTDTPAQTATETARETAIGTPTLTAERPAYDCDAANRPAPPDHDANPPGDNKRYTYPSQPESLSNEEIRTYSEQYERAYRLNKLYSQHGAHLEHASVSVRNADIYAAPARAVIVQVKYTYDAEIEGDDGPIEIDSPILYASYYVDDEVVLRAVNKRLQEDVSRLVADPLEQGEPVECF